MPKRRLYWIIAICIVLTTAVVFGLTRQGGKNDRAPAIASAATATSPTIELLPGDVVQATIADLRQALSLSGSLRAVNQATIKSRVAGEVREVMVREGESVAANQIVARMDGTEYQARAAQARGALVAAEGQRTIAVKSRDANQALLGKGFISKNAFDNTASQYDIAQANVDSARAALDVAQKSLGDTVIRAPIAGLVSNRTVQPGEKVPADFHLLDIVNLGKMEMEVAVPTNQIRQIKLGQEAVLTIEGMPQPFVGNVARINPSTQSGSRSIVVYVEVPNPQNLLRVGMFGLARMTLVRHDGAITIPATAVQKTTSGSFVYTVVNGLLQQHPVTLGITGETIADETAGVRSDTTDREAIEVVTGIKDRAQVVRYNLGNLILGSRVTFASSAANASTNAATNSTSTATPGTSGAPTTTR